VVSAEGSPKSETHGPRTAILLNVVLELGDRLVHAPQRLQHDGSADFLVGDRKLLPHL
jgi:hypothetical protein